ncbi:glutamate 5-kinase [uncultured Brevundimonas sp.]|uniref:glutamate 5-kinase n=1 Tax=uncultured Brevundimonas sp. TaxID=213418 RepID=UPI0026005857|nr:glutamate 5-kinase [uncultured Brevundimonas sp.]
MSVPDRSAQAIAGARRIVVKIGSSLLVDGNAGAVDQARLAALTATISGWLAEGKQVLVVSSGAVALGARRLGSTTIGQGLERKQAAAAVGQSLLMRAWGEAFAPHERVTAQILLTLDDTETRRRWLNARATVATLLDLGVVPVVNENDTVATDEIRYGDNDRLAARVAQMIGADLLILLSDVDGLYTADPRRDPAARHIPFVEALTPEIESMATGANAEAAVGTGGMTTKLMAARIAAEAGCATLIADGRQALDDMERSTLIAASTTARAAWKQWIGGSLATRGTLVVDAGCAEALAAGKSLLAVGLLSVEGDFGKGDAVQVATADGQPVARGLVRYDAADAARIVGVASAGLKAALGYEAGPVVIHADDLTLR